MPFHCLLLQSAISATRHELYMAYIYFFSVSVCICSSLHSICMLEGVEIQCNHGVIYNHVVAAVILVKPKPQCFAPASTPANKPLELGLAIAIRRRWKMLSYRPRRCWILGFTNVPLTRNGASVNNQTPSIAYKKG